MPSYTMLIAVALKTTLLLATAVLVCRLLASRSSACRHLLWTLTLALSLVMPFAAIMLPSWFAVAVPWLDAGLRNAFCGGRCRRGGVAGAIGHRGRVGMRGDRPPGSPGFRGSRAPSPCSRRTPSARRLLDGGLDADSSRSSRRSRSPRPRIAARIQSMHLGRLAAHAAASCLRRGLAGVEASTGPVARARALEALRSRRAVSSRGWPARCTGTTRLSGWPPVS